MIILRESGIIGKMSKYERLWEYVIGATGDEKGEITMSFEEIEKVSGAKLDHSFLSSKKELVGSGCEVCKISLKNRTVTLSKNAERHE